MMGRDELYVMFLKTDSFVEDISVLNNFPKGASVLFYIDVEGIDEVCTKLKGCVKLVKSSPKDEEILVESMLEKLGIESVSEKLL